MADEDVLLNVAGVIPCSHVNGPGKRFTIWVQGCTLKCKGCFNTSLQPHTPKHLVDPIEFSEKVIKTSRQEECEGISISGGEPFQQSRALSRFTHEIKKNGLTVICYTGYPDSMILNSPDQDIRSFLDNIDVLVTGPFNANDDHKCVWIDHTDKKILFLTDAYRKIDFQQTVSAEYIIDDEQFGYSGFPEDDSIKTLLSNDL